MWDLPMKIVDAVVEAKDDIIAAVTLLALCLGVPLVLYVTGQ